MGDLPGLPPSAPRILIVMADQWPRALLRAALRETGYDAIGTRTLSGALAHPARAVGRGPVRAIVVDWSAVDTEADARGSLRELRERHGAVPTVLLASAVRADPPGDWVRVIRRPFSIEEVVRVVTEIVPQIPDPL
jgi:hypothetical protein